MASRFYLVPEATTDLGGGLTRRAPKYIDGAIVRWTAMDYGNEPVMLVAADVSGAQHATIAANADVVSAPLDLDTTVGAQLLTVQTALDDRRIPGEWVTAAMTYRSVLRWVARLFLLSQRHQGLFAGRFLPVGLTLASTVGDLTALQRQRVIAAADSLALDTSTITTGMTIRAALRTLGNQITLPIRLGDL